SYTNGTGNYGLLDQISAEGAAMFRRGTGYYIVFGQDCPYCGATPVKYVRAPSPLGPWGPATQINDTSCGGQPSFVTATSASSGNAYLFGADLWKSDYADNQHHGWPNQSLANYYWGVLTFDASGNIQPFGCGAQ